MYSNSHPESTLHKMNNFGLRDKYDQSAGLTHKNPEDIQFTTHEHTIIVDSRDCVGVNSLKDSRTFFEFNGGRRSATGNIVTTSGQGVYPTVVTVNSVQDLKDGDVVVITSVHGNKTVNGVHSISAVNSSNNTFTINTKTTNAYNGGGIWTRDADSGFPSMTNKESTIVNNQMIINLESELKFLRSLSLFHIVIPRDIIPLNYLLSDFITASTSLTNTTYAGITESNYTTYIPQEPKLLEERILGFYSSPLDIWRSYDNAAFSMPNQVTPPPLELWNPPGPGAWPLQPIPYPFQTVPTYRSNTFKINDVDNYVILAGYGVYDLVDWTVDTGNPVSDSLNTSIIRKLLLILLCPIQSYNNNDYIDLILNSNTTSNLTTSAAFGFGDYQRYVPGPGLQLNYQPNTNTAYTTLNSSGPPNVSGLPDSPIPFPNFRGNIWGPYNKPGDRFQKFGLRDTVQDLFLNGDLNNLLGTPIISPNVPPDGIRLDPNYGLNFSALIAVNMGNINNTANPNIINAMRISSNGFGTSVVRAQGGGVTYTSVYNSVSGFGGGGIGPSTLGTPSSWVNNGIYSATGSFADPLAQGPLGPNVTTATSDSTTPGTTVPTYSTSYYDSGANNGRFTSQVSNYTGYTVNDLPDTDLIIRVEEARRDERVQTTRSINRDAIMDVPIRLNLGSTSGTFQYIESLQSLLAQATSYWQKRYVNSKASIGKLHLFFYDYEGREIPLEKMLQTRGVSGALQRLIRIDDFFNSSFDLSGFSQFSFLFDPLNPQLIGRMKRYIQIMFKVEAYQGMPPGLESSSFASNQSSGVFSKQNYS